MTHYNEMMMKNEGEPEPSLEKISGILVATKDGYPTFSKKGNYFALQPLREAFKERGFTAIIYPE